MLQPFRNACKWKLKTWKVAESLACKQCKRYLTHFQILGVEESATTDDIKTAFRKKAKELHPDRARDSNISLQDAHKRFVQLRAAYEVLVDPTSRGTYIREIRMESARPATSSGYQSSQSSYNKYEYHYQQQYDQYDYDEEFPEIRYRRRRRKSSDFGKKAANMILHDITSWEAFEKELENAINTAIYGPGFTPTATNKYPDDMETEELQTIHNIKRDNVIMHVVNGRLLLGKILLNPTPYEKLPSNQHIEAAVLPRERDFLELIWENKLTARATLLRHELRPETLVLDFDLLDEASGDVSLKNVGRMVEINANMWGRRQEAILDLQGRETHRIIRTYFPGVQSIYIYNSIHRYIEYKCSRAWMPKSSLWMFEPRDAGFDAGGWYIQRNRDGKFSRFQKRVMERHNMSEDEFLKKNFQYDPNGASNVQTSFHEKKELDPALCLLICGFASLDRMRKTDLFTK